MSFYGEPETMGEAIELVIERRLIDVRTAQPGKIVRWDPELQVADVQPMLAVEIPNNDDPETSSYWKSPIIPSVPVIFPRCRDAWITFPVHVGDTVLIVCQDRDATEWRVSGQVSDPDDPRLHHINHAVALVGYYPRIDPMTEVDPDDIVIGWRDGNRVHVGPSDTRFGGDGAKTADRALALAQETRDELEKIREAFNAHTHLYLPGPGALEASNGPTPVPSVIPIPAIVNVGSARVKTED